MSKSSQKYQITAHDLMRKKQHGEKIVSLTAYDYTTAKLIDETDAVDFILVGDSLGMVVLGYPDTLSVTMEDMLHHVKAVARGTKRALLVADMPFMSVHVDKASAVRNAARMVQEGGASAVKLEGATDLTLATVSHLVSIGIPVMGHLGFTPQSVNAFGGFKRQGKTMAAVKQLVTDALALEKAGAFAIVLEMIPAEVAAVLTRQLTIPTIGIGAGVACDGQILVIDDMLGRFPDFKPMFVRTYAQVGEAVQQAARQYAVDVMDQSFPEDASEAFHFNATELEALQAFEDELNTQRKEAVAHDCC